MKKKLFLAFVILKLVSSLFLISHSQAIIAAVVESFASIFAPVEDGIVIPEPPRCEDCGPIPLNGALDIRYHRVDVTIDQQVAITHVDQVFHNPNEFTVEGTYIFPLPKDAAVTDFTLWIDDQPVEGKILSAEEARAIYEEIVRQLIDPAILEYAGQGAVQASIFPIEPGEDRRIELEYTQTLALDNGLVRYTYPLNTEKFSRTPLEQVAINVDVTASNPIRLFYSPTHDIAISRETDSHVRAGYEAANVTPDTDFTLYYSLGETEAFHLLTYRDPNDPTDPDGFYMLLLAPRPDAAEQPVPKDVLIVLDKSGSMDGEKYIQAQQAVRFILERLNPEDGFNVIRFSTDIERYSPELLPASEAGDAIQWVEADRALGSTNINGALLEAADLVQSTRPTYVIFLTDGLATEGEIDTTRILDNFAAAAPANVRLFAFGVGYDVDTFLLDLLAQHHHGASSYVVPGERIDEQVAALYQKISAPVMTDLELEFTGVAVLDDYPTPLPDLFAGSQIILVGRYQDGGMADATLTGIVDGQEQTFTFSAQRFSSGFEESPETPALQAIPRLWATRKIGYLLNEIRLHGPDEETIDQIVRLSIRYGIVTPYTSYLVTEDFALGDEAIQELSANEFEQAAAAPAPAASGEGAVQDADQQRSLEEADVASSSSAQTVRIVGSRTYINLDGIWTDTAFDPDTMTTLKVPFLSEDYFALAGARPELGAAFALGNRVIAFSGGEAFEVIDPDGQGDPVEIEPQGAATPEGQSPQGTESDPAQPTDSGDDSGNVMCFGVALPFVFIPLGVVVWKKKRGSAQQV